MAIYKGTTLLTGSSSGTGHTIQDDGTDVTDRANLNFQSPLTVTDDSTNDATVIDITLTDSDIPNLNASKINAGVLDRARISADTPTDGQILSWDNTNSSMTWVDDGGSDYTLPAATSSALGGVIVESASDIDVDSDGKLTLGTLTADSKLSSGSATDGHVLTADGSGGVAWEVAPGAGTVSLSGNNTFTGDNTFQKTDNPGFINLTRSDSSPSDDDFVGQIDFNGNNDASPAVEVQYGRISVQSADVSSANEKGEMLFQVHSGSSGANNFLRSGIKITGNSTGEPDVEVRNATLTGTPRLSDLTGGTNKIVGISSDGTLSVTDKATPGSNVPNKPSTPASDTKYELQITSGGTATWEAASSGGVSETTGTFTPSLDSAPSACVTNTASYVRQGSLVHVYGRLGCLSNTDNSVVAFTRSSLPFTPVNYSIHGGSSGIGSGTTATFANDSINASSKHTQATMTASLVNPFGAGGDALEYQNISGKTYFYSFTYVTNAT